jgi:hypothetical protein
MRSRKFSRFLLFWLLLVLGDLLKNASHLVSCLPLLEEKDQHERVNGHPLVQVCRLELMCLGLHEEDLFTLLLCHGYFHHLMEAATLEVAKKLYSMLHDLCIGMRAGFLAVQSQQISWLPTFGKPATALRFP